MSNHRYSPEFRDEAVRQIIEAGHSVTEGAARLGVSANRVMPPARILEPLLSEEHEADNKSIGATLAAANLVPDALIIQTYIHAGV